MGTRNLPELGGGGTGKLYYSISEVAELVGVKPHVLRYWETQFKMLRPRKNRAGNRSYRVKDVKMALRVKKLLYDEGFTIAGARRKLLDERRSGVAQTEIDFVGISREDFIRLLERDLRELILVLEGKRSVELLGHADEDGDEVAGALAGRAGLFEGVDVDDPDAAGEETEDDEGARPAAAAEGEERARTAADAGDREGDG